MKKIIFFDLDGKLFEFFQNFSFPVAKSHSWNAQILCDSTFPTPVGVLQKQGVNDFQLLWGQLVESCSELYEIHLMNGLGSGIDVWI